MLCRDSAEILLWRDYRLTAKNSIKRLYLVGYFRVGPRINWFSQLSRTIYLRDKLPSRLLCARFRVPIRQTLYCYCYLTASCLSREKVSPHPRFFSVEIVIGGERKVRLPRIFTIFLVSRICSEKLRVKTACLNDCPTFFKGVRGKIL